MMKKKVGEEEEETRDGTVDFYGRPSIRSTSGQWTAGIIILRMFSLLLSNIKIKLYFKPIFLEFYQN